MEYCMFPMRVLRVTQGYNTGSHLGSWAIDLGGKDGGQDPVFAPFSGTVARLRHGANGELYLHSDSHVKFADGTVSTATAVFLHDGDFNVQEGQHIKQGQHIYDEGGMGRGNPNRFANHLHLEICKGYQIRQYANTYGVYRTPNSVKPEDAFLLGSDVLIMNDGGLKWIRRHQLNTDDKKITQLARDVINGVYGNGEDRKKALGGLYEPVQAKVNEILRGGK